MLEFKVRETLLFNILGIAHARTKKTTFSCKDDCRCILEWGKGLVKKSRLYPARAYITLVVLVVLCCGLEIKESRF